MSTFTPSIVFVFPDPISTTSASMAFASYTPLASATTKPFLEPTSPATPNVTDCSRTLPTRSAPCSSVLVAACITSCGSLPPSIGPVALRALSKSNPPPWLTAI